MKPNNCYPHSTAQYIHPLSYCDPHAGKNIRTIANSLFRVYVIEQTCIKPGGLNDNIKQYYYIHELIDFCTILIYMYITSSIPVCSNYCGSGYSREFKFSRIPDFGTFHKI